MLRPSRKRLPPRGWDDRTRAAVGRGDASLAAGDRARPLRGQELGHPGMTVPSLTYHVPNKPFLGAVCEVSPPFCSKYPVTSQGAQSQGWKSLRPGEDDPSDRGAPEGS